MGTFHGKLNRFSRNITAFFDERLSHYGMAVSYIETLLIITHEAECSQKQLSSDMGLAPSTITRFIEKLVNKGYVVKKRQGKEVYVTLTSAGIDITGKMKKDYKQAEKELQQLLGTKYLETTGKLAEFGIELTEKEIM